MKIPESLRCLVGSLTHLQMKQPKSTVEPLTGRESEIGHDRQTHGAHLGVSIRNSSRRNMPMVTMKHGLTWVNMVNVHGVLRLLDVYM